VTEQTHNASESAYLSQDDQVQGELARQALSSLRKTFHDWMMIIARFVARMRERADQIGGRRTFARLLDQQGFGDEKIREIGGKPTISRLEKIGRHVVEVEAWHETLTSRQKFEWAAPTKVMQHCAVLHESEKPKLAPSKSKSAMETLRHENEVLQAENARLKRDRSDLFTAHDSAPDISVSRVSNRFMRLPRFEIMRPFTVSAMPRKPSNFSSNVHSGPSNGSRRTVGMIGAMAMPGTDSGSRGACQPMRLPRASTKGNRKGVSDYNCV
jgi:hypothetical protein